jgi:hypothetical protein
MEGGIASKKPSRFAKQAPTAAAPSDTSATAESEGYVDYDDMNLTVLEIAASASSTRCNKRGRNSSSLQQQQQPPNKLSKAAIEELMDAKREEALGQSIATENNKGFQLLTKFGYSKEIGGGGLGKDQKGINQPLAVVKREAGDRLGLGAVDPIKQQVEDALKQKQQQTVQRDQMAAHFQSNVQAQQVTLKVQRLLKKAGKVVLELDSREGIPQHDLWPPEFCETRPASGSSGDVAGGHGSEEVAVGEEYFAIYTDDDGPPTGSNRNRLATHHSSSTALGGASSGSTTEVGGVQVDPGPQLEASLTYLRSNYSYCMYCGCQYENQADLLASCPGLTEDDHE